ncbi:His/Gly/Thr/Pro-type tRNA ligase C-terminal domain-containing protein [Streptomyces sp. NPDC088358]|uniref:His/Gly/Thr/Pro-type tRNA ligase C-terminal domain-containing protein n=1 Tax=Streptomyces sp. NPDC088358 TaxID=3365857 RepID=UPI0038100AE6
MNLTVPDPHGSGRPVHMACSGIGITRCLQTLSDLHRDRHGLRWNPGTGPADLHLIVLRADLPEMRERTARAVRKLQDNGTRLLVDDRHEAAGEKFAYAQLIGPPAPSSSPRNRPTGRVEVIDRWTGRHDTTPLDRIPVPEDSQ